VERAAVELDDQALFGPIRIRLDRDLAQLERLVVDRRRQICTQDQAAEPFLELLPRPPHGVGNHLHCLPYCCCSAAPRVSVHQELNLAKVEQA
jgi:hypothetical protein